MKQSIDTQSWLSSPYNVRLFILRFMCSKNLCGKPITLEICNELLIAFSFGYHKDTSLEKFFNDKDSTYFDHILRLDGYVICWDGDAPIQNAWFHAVNSIKKQLSRPTFNETIA